MDEYGKATMTMSPRPRTVFLRLLMTLDEDALDVYHVPVPVPIQGIVHVIPPEEEK